MEAKIIELLSTKTEPTPTLEIARHVGGKGSAASLVNPTLYQMEKAGKVTKLAEENGAKPRWSLKPPTVV